MIVRRRLAQKMAFVSDDLAVVAEPSEAELRKYFDTHRESYTSPDLYALRHVYFNPDRHTALDADAATKRATCSGVTCTSPCPIA